MLGSLIARIRKEKGILKVQLAKQTRNQRWAFNSY